MQQQPLPIQSVISLIQSLPTNLQREVEHYAEFIRHRHLQSQQESLGEWTKEDERLLSLHSIQRAWGPEDSVYDNL